MGVPVAYVPGGRFDPPFMPTKTKPYIKGIRVEVPNGVPIVEDFFSPATDVELVAVAIAANRYDDRDHWNLFVNGEQICDEVYMKELPEGIFLTVILPIKAGQTIKFEFVNRSMSAKVVWLNYQTLR